MVLSYAIFSDLNLLLKTSAYAFTNCRSMGNNDEKHG